LPRLVIKNLGRETSGDFKVRAVNAVGESASSCNVKVAESQQQQQQQQQLVSVSTKTSQTSERTLIKEVTKAKKEVAPKFVSPVQGVIAEEGSSLTLTGVLQGQPEPEVSWLHRGQPVKQDANVRVETKNKKTTLCIKKVSWWSSLKTVPTYRSVLVSNLSQCYKIGTEFYVKSFCERLTIFSLNAMGES
jgi:hypothetical protein